MGNNFKLTGGALAVAAAFGVLASGSAVAAAGPLDGLSIPQVIVNPPSQGVSASLTATGTTPLGSVNVTASGSGSISTSIGNPGSVLNGVAHTVTGVLGGAGAGTVDPLGQVQGAVGQVVGALGGGNAGGAVGGAVSGAVGGAVGAVTGALGGANNPAGALTGALNTASGALSGAIGTATGALG